MMNTARRTEHRNALLWVALIAPGAAWLAQLTACFMVAAYACAPDRMWILHTISAAALAIGGAGVWSAWRNWRVRQSHDAREIAAGGDVLASGTFIFAVLILLTIAATELSNWLLEPCI